MSQGAPRRVQTGGCYHTVATRLDLEQAEMRKRQAAPVLTPNELYNQKRRERAQKKRERKIRQAICDNLRNSAPEPTREEEVQELWGHADIREYLTCVKVWLLGGPCSVEVGSSLSRDGLVQRISEEVRGLRELEVLW
jgi:hypothetical protein